MRQQNNGDCQTQDTRRITTLRECHHSAVPSGSQFLLTMSSSGNSGGHTAAEVLWPLLFGNFVIGTGVMVVPGTLNDISSSLAISVPVAGQLITAAAAVMCVGAPLFASVVAGCMCACWRCRCCGTPCFWV